MPRGNLMACRAELSVSNIYLSTDLNSTIIGSWKSCSHPPAFRVLQKNR